MEGGDSAIADKQPCFYLFCGRKRGEGGLEGANSFLGPLIDDLFNRTQGMTSVVFFYQVLGVHVSFWLPGVVR